MQLAYLVFKIIARSELPYERNISSTRSNDEKLRCTHQLISSTNFKHTNKLHIMIPIKFVIRDIFFWTGSIIRKLNVTQHTSKVELSLLVIDCVIVKSTIQSAASVRCTMPNTFRISQCIRIRENSFGWVGRMPKASGIVWQQYRFESFWYLCVNKRWNTTTNKHTQAHTFGPPPPQNTPQQMTFYTAPSYAFSIHFCRNVNQKMRSYQPQSTRQSDMIRIYGLHPSI